ncbi:MAG: hypothetical protein ABSF44_10870 [Candidatus Bathyarchaeia archaeon]|jgi:hypothetical protein
MNLIEIATLVAAVGSVIAAVTGIIALYKTSREEKNHFELLRGTNPPEPPNAKLGLVISHPTKPIDECRVFYNKTALNIAQSNPIRQHTYIHVGGMAVYRLPENVDDNGKITVKDGKTTLLKIKLGKI